jgi:hypothetical protein
MVINTTVITVKITKFRTVNPGLLTPQAGQNYGVLAELGAGRNYYDMMHSQTPGDMGHFLEKKHLWLS